MKCVQCDEKLDRFDNYFECLECGGIYCECCAVDGEQIIECTDCNKYFCANCFAFHAGYVKSKREEKEKVAELKKKIRPCYCLNEFGEREGSYIVTKDDKHICYNCYYKQVIDDVFGEEVKK